MESQIDQLNNGINYKELKKYIFTLDEKINNLISKKTNNLDNNPNNKPLSKINSLNTIKNNTIVNNQCTE